MTRQRGSGPGSVEAALKTSISASSAASASSMNGRSESSSRHPPLVDRLMHDHGSVAAPDAEIELEGHVVELGELGSAGLPPLRARRIRPAIVSQRPSQFL
jgi:hypothetical protein